MAIYWNVLIVWEHNQQPNKKPLNASNYLNICQILELVDRCSRSRHNTNLKSLLTTTFCVKTKL